MPRFDTALPRGDISQLDQEIPRQKANSEDSGSSIVPLLHSPDLYAPVVKKPYSRSPKRLPSKTTDDAPRVVSARYLPTRLAIINKPFADLKNKAMGRSRQTSKELKDDVDKRVMSTTSYVVAPKVDAMNSRCLVRGTKITTSGGRQSLAKACKADEDEARPQLMKSKTTSFLPMPTKPASRPSSSSFLKPKTLSNNLRTIMTDVPPLVPPKDTSQSDGMTNQRMPNPNTVPRLSQEAARLSRKPKISPSPAQQQLPTPPIEYSAQTALSNKGQQAMSSPLSIPHKSIPNGGPKHLSQLRYKLPRSTTTPNLGTALLSHRAPELCQDSARWPLVNDQNPLVWKPSNESAITNVSARFREHNHLHASLASRYQDWSGLQSPRKPYVDQRHAGFESFVQHWQKPQLAHQVRGPKPIECRKLLRPIQPVSPPSNGVQAFRPEPAHLTPPIVYNSLIGPPRAAEPAGFDSTPVVSDHGGTHYPLPLNSSQTPADAEVEGQNALPVQSIFEIDDAKDNKYWSGRFTSLQDRLINDELFNGSYRVSILSEDACSSSSSSSDSKPSSGICHGRTSIPDISNDRSEYKRAELIFKTLAEYCTTYDAHRSLLIFRNLYAAAMHMPGLKIAMPLATWQGKDGCTRASMTKTGDSVMPKLDELMKSSSSRGSDVGSNKIGGSMLSTGNKKLTLMERLRGRKSSGRVPSGGDGLKSEHSAYF